MTFLLLGDKLKYGESFCVLLKLRRFFEPLMPSLLELPIIPFVLSGLRGIRPKCMEFIIFLRFVGSFRHTVLLISDRFTVFTEGFLDNEWLFVFRLGLKSTLDFPILMKPGFSPFSKLNKNS